MSKSSSSSRTSSPRAMPVETIITRFKSAQQKRQLREMDRSMTKVTELLKNPLKPKVKKKESLKKQKSSPSKEDVEEGKRTKKRPKNEKETEEEFCPMKVKRNVVLNKVQLKPKHQLKVIAKTNKRKRSVPKKGLTEDTPEQTDSDNTMSPKAKRLKSHHGMTMDEMIQLIEESGSLNDEDLLEILTCPSPVWWEDPPDGYIEDALFTRPRSSAEMYPSVRSQLQEDLQKRQRSSTPNILSRRERVSSKSVSDNSEVKEVKDFEVKNEEESSSNNDIDLEITLSKRDEKFIKKRSKLESVLGNLKNKTINDIKKPKPVGEIDNSQNANVSNKVSVIKNLCSNDVKSEEKCLKEVKCDETTSKEVKCVETSSKEVKTDEKSENSVNQEKDKEKKDSVPMVVDSEGTDDERLTDISFQDDSFLNDLENMDIPVQDKPKPPPSPKKVQVPKKIESVILLPVLIKDISDIPKLQPIKQYKTPDYAINNCPLNKYGALNFKRFKHSPIDPTYSNKKSSIIEDYFEMKLFEEDDAIVKKKQNEYSKCGIKSASPPKYKNDAKQKENNLKTSVIKFKNSDNTCINVFKIESVVPKNLPPLKNCDRRKGNVGCMPENLPPLRRNPGVIHLNSDSPKSCKSTTSHTSESSINQDNMDSISDTNICFLNEDDVCVENKMGNNYVLDGITSTVIKSSNDIRTNGSQNGFNGNKTKCNNNIFQTNDLHLTLDGHLYRNLSQINGVIANDYNDLEVQSLTITKVNDNCCCTADKKLNAERKHKDNVKIPRDKGKRAKAGLTTVESNNNQTELNPQIHNEIGKLGNENSDCITVYKIISDDSGNDEPKLDTTDTKNRKDNTNLQKKGKAIEKSDNYDKDKMIYYFKKCKNLYWKHKNVDKIENKKSGNEKNELINETNTTEKVVNHTEDIKDDSIDNDKKNSKNNTGCEENTETKITDDNEKEESDVNHNNNITNDTKEQKSIIVSNTNQIRYCMKCSSIFDTAQCNYCYRKNHVSNANQFKYCMKCNSMFNTAQCTYCFGKNTIDNVNPFKLCMKCNSIFDTAHCNYCFRNNTTDNKNSADSKNQSATDYLLKMKQWFTCDVCSYKALSKDSLERHVLKGCCDKPR